MNQTYYEYKLKDQSPNHGCRSIPWIQMRGQWLEQIGFSIDTPITVRAMEGCLVLTAQHDNNQ